MSWKSVYQVSVLLLCVLRAYRCEQSENISNPDQSPFLEHSAHVLEHGRIISTPVSDDFSRCRSSSDLNPGQASDAC